MSLSGALSNAMGGLTANARGTAIISSNIANALNENYGRRGVSLTTDATQSSGGVKVANVTRFTDPVLAHQKRLAAAELGQSRVYAGFASDLEQLWGSVDTIGSIAGKLTKFEAALVSAATDPSSATRMQSVAMEANAFATSIRSASDGVQHSRSRAEDEIAAMVDRMNTSLARVEQLNDKIQTARHLGQDALGLMDQRDAELESISEIVPLHVIERDTGAVALFTKQGRSLLDGRAVELSFEKQPLIEAHMTVDNGLLGSLMLNGDPVEVSGRVGLAGGALAAQFDIRDVAAVDAQTHLDALARDLIDRFGPSGPDATIPPRGIGIFTDSGAAFDAANEIGVSGRLELNTTLQPASSELWKWRDGLNATVPGDSGSSDLITSLHAQIAAPLVPSSAALGTQPRSFVGHVQQISSDISANRVRTQDETGFATAQYSELRERSANNGVNSDEELQKLIELEKSYAANARVVRVVDDMLAELLRI